MFLLQVSSRYKYLTLQQKVNPDQWVFLPSYIMILMIFVNPLEPQAVADCYIFSVEARQGQIIVRQISFERFPDILSFFSPYFDLTFLGWSTPRIITAALLAVHALNVLLLLVNINLSFFLFNAFKCQSGFCAKYICGTATRDVLTPGDLELMKTWRSTGKFWCQQVLSSFYLWLFRDKKAAML